jgi:ABC-type multidrug transport system ATPase subunit
MPEQASSGVSLRSVTRRFGAAVALRDVSLDVPHGSISALLGPNGAGKTTLLRLLTGLVAPSEGGIWVAGHDVVARPAATRRLIGWMPSGDRTFYLRLSGLENLVFFGRLQGLRRRDAAARAREVLEQVDLGGAARQRVGAYSHGMQKRLSMARALLTDPRVLLIDEATHDLDPSAARRVKELVRSAADRGAAVIWATQRLDEVRGFADAVVMLDRGEVRFHGAVEELLATAAATRFILRTSLSNGAPADVALERLEAALAGRATVERLAGEGILRVSLGRDGALPEVLDAAAAAGLLVEDCTHELSAIEAVFLQMTGAGG